MLLPLNREEILKPERRAETRPRREREPLQKSPPQLRVAGCQTLREGRIRRAVDEGRDDQPTALARTRHEPGDGRQGLLGRVRIDAIGAEDGEPQTSESIVVRERGLDLGARGARGMARRDRCLEARGAARHGREVAERGADGLPRPGAVDRRPGLEAQQANDAVAPTRYAEVPSVFAPPSLVPPPKRKEGCVMSARPMKSSATIG